jgi:hypothetical protein
LVADPVAFLADGEEVAAVDRFGRHQAGPSC